MATLESTMTSIIKASFDFADKPEALSNYLAKVEELATTTHESVKEQQTKDAEHSEWHKAYMADLGKMSTHRLEEAHFKLHEVWECLMMQSDEKEALKEAAEMMQYVLQRLFPPDCPLFSAGDPMSGHRLFWDETST
jgi:hypothetical protein